jgi:hypothetical protein
MFISPAVRLLAPALQGQGTRSSFHFITPRDVRSQAEQLLFSLLVVITHINPSKHPIEKSSGTLSAVRTFAIGYGRMGLRQLIA